MKPALFAAPNATSESAVCQSLMGKFVGLPSLDREGAVAVEAPAPLAGRWWIQQCRSETAGRELTVRLAGPGWYFIDESDGHFRLHQQVPLELAITLTGTLRVDHSGSVVYVWFEPSRQPDIQVHASNDLDVHGEDSWDSLVASIASSPVQQQVAERVSKRAADSFRATLGRGVTMTYDIWRDQSDLALGILEVGKAPAHAFDDDESWLVNEQLALPSGATHVVGPFDPGSRYKLDVLTDRGPGIRYRAICSADMRAQFAAISRGRPDRIVPRAVIATGQILGEGPHAAELAEQSCPFYLVVSGAETTTTLAGLRVRF